MDFQDAGDKRVATTDDLSLTPEEVNSVLITLRDHGIDATTLRLHMLDDSREPKYGVHPMPLGCVQGVFSTWDSV